MIGLAAWLMALAVAAGGAPAAGPPDNPDAARCLDSSNAKSEARAQACTRLIETPGLAAKDAAAYRTARGRALLDQKRYADSETDASAAILAAPQVPEAYFIRALARTRLSRPDQAKADYDILLRLTPNDADALYNRALIEGDAGDHAGALKDLERARPLAPKDADTLVQLATEYDATDRAGDALATYAAVLAFAPKNRNALLDRAIVYFGQKDNPNAERAIRAGLAAYPDDSGMHDEAGAIAERQGDRKQAMAEYDRAISLDNTNIDALSDRAQLALAEGAYGKAAADYAVIVGTLKPGDPDAVADLIDALIQKDDYKQALTLTDAALKQAPANVALHIARGRIMEHADRYDEALADYAAALAKDPASDAALYDRALVYFDQGHADLAIRDLDAALRAKPGDADDLEERGAVYQWLEDYVTAIEKFDAAIAADPKRASVFTKRAEARRKLGDVGGAAADEATAKALKPKA